MMQFILVNITMLLATFITKPFTETWVDNAGNKVPVKASFQEHTIVHDMGTIISDKSQFDFEADSLIPAFGDEVDLGGQIWMSRNLDVVHFRNGDAIPEARSHEEWAAASENKQPAWCYYQNRPDMFSESGRLYNWYAVTDPRGLAPEGWMIPSTRDWDEFSDFLGIPDVELRTQNRPFRPEMAPFFIADYDMDNPWFRAWAGGLRSDQGGFSNHGNRGFWWSSTSSSETFGSVFEVGFPYIEVYRHLNSCQKGSGHSVRCIRLLEDSSDQVNPQANPIPMQQEPEEGMAEDISKEGILSPSLVEVDSASFVLRGPEVILPVNPTFDTDFIRISPDQKFLLTAVGSNENLQLWDLASGKPLYRLFSELYSNSHVFQSQMVSFSSDGSRLLLVKDTKELELWNLQSGSRTIPFNEAPLLLSYACLTPDATGLVLAQDNEISFWELASGKRKATLFNKEGGVHMLQFSRNQRFMLSCGHRSACLWNLPEQREIMFSEEHGYLVAGAFSSDGQKLITASSDGRVRIWNTETGELLQLLDGLDGDVISVAFNPEASMAIIINSPRSTLEDVQVCLWDIAAAKLVRDKAPFNQGSYMSASIASDGKRVAMLERTGRVSVWDTFSGSLLFDLPGTDDIDRITGLSFGSESSILVTYAYDRASIWNGATGERISSIGGEIVKVSSYLSPDEKLVCSRSKNWEYTWEVESGNIIAENSCLGEFCNNAISPDGSKYFYHCYNDSLWELREVHSGKLLHTFSAYGAKFSPDSKQVLTISNDRKTIQCREILSGELLQSLSTDARIISARGHQLNKNAEAVIAKCTGHEDEYCEYQIWFSDAGKRQLSFKAGIPSLYPDIEEFAGSSLLIADKDHVEVWDLGKATCALKVNIPASQKYASSGAAQIKDLRSLSPGGEFLAAVVSETIEWHGERSIFCVWKSATGELVFKGNPEFLITSLEFNSDGSRLVCSTLYVTEEWDVSSGKLLFRRPAAEALGRICSAGYAPDGLRLAVTYRNDVMIISAFTGDSLMSFHAEEFDFVESEFITDGNILLVLGNNGRSLHWDCNNGVMLSQLSNYGYKHVLGNEQSGHEGLFLVSNYEAMEVEVWDKKKLRYLYTRMTFDNGDWLIFDDGFRMDGTEGGMQKISVVCGATAADQALVKKYLHVPGLAAKKVSGIFQTEDKLFKPKDFGGICD